jgi:hypothetical protein
MFWLSVMGAMAIFWIWMASHWPLYGYLYMLNRIPLWGDDRVYPHDHVVFELAILENFGLLAFSLWGFCFFLRAKPLDPDDPRAR